MSGKYEFVDYFINLMEEESLIKKIDKLEKKLLKFEKKVKKRKGNGQKSRMQKHRDN